MCLASERASSLLGFLVPVFVAVISLSSQLLLVSFSFFFFSFRFDLIFSFVPWSHSIFVPCGLFTLSEKTLAPFHLGAQGGCSQPRAAWRRVLCSVPRYGNMVTDRVQIPLFKSFSFFKGGGESWWEKKQAVKIALCVDRHPFAKLNDLIFHAAGWLPR